MICGDSCDGKLVVIYGDLWWFMSSFVVVHVMVCGGLWYFHQQFTEILTKTCFFSQNMGYYPSFQSSQKVNPTS